MTATGAEAQPIRKAPRWMWFLLVASLALNILVVGVIGGSMWAWRHGGPWAHRSMTSSLLGFVASLPKDRREELWRIAKDYRSEFRPIRTEARAARKAVRDALQTRPFDKAAYDAAQAKALEVESRARTSGLKLLGDVAAKLTDDERRAFASWHEQSRARWRWARRGRHWFEDNDNDEARPAKP